MKRSCFISLLVGVPLIAFGKKRRRASSTPEPTDSDWVWESGPYRAWWVNEDPNGFAYLSGPEFPETLRIMKDGIDDLAFKNRLMSLVDRLAG